MRHSIVDSKGRVTIPKAVREHMGLNAGARVTFTAQQYGLAVLRVKAGDDTDTRATAHSRPGSHSD